MASMAQVLLVNKMNRYCFWTSSILTMCIVLTACHPVYPTIEKLLIDATVFPSGWLADPEGPKPDSLAPFGGIRSIERTTLYFESKTSAASEEIQLFESYDRAKEDFIRQKSFSFQDDKEMGPYITPNELNYQSKIASQFHFACVRPSYYPYPYIGCLYLAQYGSYVVKFDIGWKLDAMNANDVESILEAIDEKMAPYTK